MGFKAKNDQETPGTAEGHSLCSGVREENLMPSRQDIEVLEPINKAVKPLQDFTAALSGEAYARISDI